MKIVNTDTLNVCESLLLTKIKVFYSDSMLYKESCFGVKIYGHVLHKPRVFNLHNFHGNDH